MLCVGLDTSWDNLGYGFQISFLRILRLTDSRWITAVLITIDCTDKDSFTEHFTSRFRMTL